MATHANILDAINFFRPYLIFSMLTALPFAIAFSAYFDGAGGVRGFLLRCGRAFIYFWMFSIFGVVTAYFMSLGLQSSSRTVVNPLIEKFGTPFVALMTAGLGFLAQKDVPRERMITVPAGVICFIFSTLILYKAFEIKFADTRRSDIGAAISEALKE